MNINNAFKNSILASLIAILLAAGHFCPAFAEGEEDEAPDNNLYVNVYVDYDKAYDVISRVNSERKKNGIGALSTDQVLMDAALVRAAENVLYFEHARPNGMSWSSVHPKVSGENLAKGSANTSKIMNMWMDSDGHRENILRSSFSSIGVAVIEHEGTFYWVQLFGRSGGSGAEYPESGSVSVPIDLPSADEGGAFALDYYITLDGEALGNERAAEIGEEGVQLGLSGYPLTFDASKVNWQLSNPEIASIDEEGVITAAARGQGTLSAYSGEIFRAEIEIDTREDIRELYILNKFPEPIVLSPEGLLSEGEDYTLSKLASKEGERQQLKIRGINEYKGIVNPVY